MGRPKLTDQQGEAPIKIPIRDKRKLHETLGADGAGVLDAQPPEAPEAPADPAAELAEARQQAASHLDDLQRIKAEFDNYRKRTQKEQSRLMEMASVGMIAQLLGVLDHFDLAVAAAGQTQDYDKMLKGVEMVNSELKSALKTCGLEIIDAVGKAFDPHEHEAAVEEEGDGSGVMVVSEVLRTGYRVKDVILRPAMVKVTNDASAADAGAVSDG